MKRQNFQSWVFILNLGFDDQRQDAKNTPKCLCDSEIEFLKKHCTCGKRYSVKFQRNELWIAAAMEIDPVCQSVLHILSKTEWSRRGAKITD